MISYSNQETNLLDSLERHCEAERTGTGGYWWSKAAAAAAADAYAIREGLTTIEGLRSTFEGGRELFQQTEALRAGRPL